MDLEAFRRSLTDAQPPSLTAPLRALWHLGRNEWDAAHGIVQDESDRDSQWVHAHLHRVEGDLSNARYWYARVGQPPHTGAVDAEWRELVTAQLAALTDVPSRR
jgi:hypothetical protein